MRASAWRTVELWITLSLCGSCVVKLDSCTNSLSSSGVNLVRGLGVVNPVAEIFDSSQKILIFQAKILTTFF